MRLSDLLGRRAGETPEARAQRDEDAEPGAPGRALAPPPELAPLVAAAQDDLARGRPAEARLRLEAAADRHPRVPVVQRLHGCALHALGEHEAAVRALGRAVDAAPRWARARLELGLALLALGRHEPAGESFTRALVLAGGHDELAARAHAGRGRLWLARGEPGRAERELARAELLLRLAPDRAGAPPAVPLGDAGADARTSDGTAEPVVPPWCAQELIAPLARVLDQRAKAPAAQARWRLLGRLPGVAPALRAQAVRALDALDEASAACQRGLAEAPADPGARAILHAALAARRLRAPGRDPGRALTEADAALALDPRKPCARAARALALAQLGRAHEALALAEHRPPPPLPLARWVAIALATGARAALVRVAELAPSLLPGATDGGARTQVPGAAPGGDQDPSASIDADAETNTDAGADALAAALSAWLALSPRSAAAPPDGFDLLGALAEHDEARRLLCEPLRPPPTPDEPTALCDQGESLARRMTALTGLAAATLAEPAAALARTRRAHGGPLRVAILGEFNTGKSSLLNLLAGTPLAPVGVTPTTSAICRVRHGRAGTRVRYRDGSERALPERALAPLLESLVAQAAAPRTGGELAARDGAGAIQEIAVTRPLPQLEDLELVDTPGLNATLPGHAARARALAEEADAVLWLWSAAQAGKASEAEALAALARAGLPVVGVLAKVDLLTRAEVDAVCAHLRASAGDSLIALVPVSTRADAEASARALLSVLRERLLPRATACQGVTTRRLLLRLCDQAARVLPEKAGETAHATADPPASEPAWLAHLREQAGRRLAEARAYIATQLAELFPARGVLDRAAARLDPDGDDGGLVPIVAELLHEAAATVAAAVPDARHEAREDTGGPAPELRPALARARADYLAAARGRAAVLAPDLAARLRTGAPGAELAHEAARALPDPEAELCAPLAAAAAAHARAHRRAAFAAARAAALRAVLIEVALREPLAELRAAALRLPARVELP